MLKRLAKPCLLSVLAFLMFSSAVLAAWEYLFPITVMDTSNTTRTYYPVMLEFGGQVLVDAGKIATSGNDTNMQIGSTNIRYMMSTTNVTAVIPNLPSGGIATVDLYTGYTPEQSVFAIITGSGGYVTTADNSTLELVDNFTISMSGYWATPASSSNYTIHKRDASRLYNNVLQSETFDILSATWTTPTGTTDPGADWAADANAIDDNTATHAFTTVVIPPTSWSAYLQFDIGSTNVSGARYYLPAGMSGDINQIDIDLFYSASWHDLFQGGLTQGAWVDVPTAGDGIVVAGVTAMRIRLYNSAGVGREGQIAEVDFDAVTIAVGVTVSGITSSNHTVAISANTTHLIAELDGATVNSTALGGASVTDNAYTWYWMRDNVTPYADNITLSVNGIRQLYYAPTSMLSGATIPDREAATNNDGTITWGSNSGISLVYGEMESFTLTELATAATGGFDMPTAPMPSTWFAAGENAVNLPFYDSFNSVASDVGMPVQAFYFWAIMGVAFGVFLGIVTLTRSALMAYIAMIVVFGIGSSMTIVPAWIVFVMIIVGVGIMYLYRQVAY